MGKEIKYYSGSRKLIEGIIWLILCLPCGFYGIKFDSPISGIICLIISALSIKSLIDYFKKKTEISINEENIQISKDEKINWNDIESIKMTSGLYVYEKYLDFVTENKKRCVAIYGLNKKPEKIKDEVISFWENHKKKNN